MNIHTTEAITALQRTVRMTIPQIGEQAAQAYENMRAEAQARQLVVNGPSIFVAHSTAQAGAGQKHCAVNLQPSARRGELGHCLCRATG